MTIKKQKRVLVISDLHCGHRVGLTPPEWQTRFHEKDSKSLKMNKWAAIQNTLWDIFAKNVKALQPIDILIMNGDCIDGKGDKWGSTEQIVVDRHEQCDMAIKALQFIQPKKILMTYGTPAHVGSEEDWEGLISDQVKAEKIGAREWVNVNGLIFDVKHYISSSTVPHGRHTAIARERVWNLLWNEHETQPKSDVIVRSHVHYFGYAGGPGWLGMTTPALQGLGSKFGSRLCQGTVDFGFVHFDVNSKDDYLWKAHLVYLNTQKAIPLVF